MKAINGLTNSLNQHLGWNKARMACFAQMLLGLIRVRTVNLQQIAVAFASQAQVSSRYRRLQRFFALFHMDLTVIAQWIFKLFFANAQSYYLVIDRTNWYCGKKKINVFMLSVAYEGVAIPLFWHLLNKAGSSNFNEQKSLINQFISTFGGQRIAGLLADREFGSGQLFCWLNQKKVPFYIRIKEGATVCIKNKKLFAAKKIFNDLPVKKMKPFYMAVRVFGARVFLAGSRSERGELMIVATNQHPRNAIPVYLRRWEIENLFQSLKGRGFQFEATRITEQERIAKLITLLAVGFAWAHKVGEWLALKKPIRTVKFQQYQTSYHTFFRYGLDYLQNVVIHFYVQIPAFKACVRLLNLPTHPLGRPSL